MRMALKWIAIENFKGIKSFSCNFAGSTTISAENGAGKTSVFDAFMWLLFDKDSTGRSAFGVRPVNDNNEPIKGLVVSVSAGIDIDGEEVVFKKTNTEKIVKRNITGYESSYWIDEVAKPLNKYKAAIKELVDEDVFKMLTNLKHVNSLHWKERRELLLSIAGDIGNPDGFEELISLLKKRTIDEHKKVLQDERKLHIKNRDQINPRIDELQKGMPAETNQARAEIARETVKNELKELNVSRETIQVESKKRTEGLDSIDKLKSKKSDRENSLKTDDSIIQPFLSEKVSMEQGIGIQNIELAKAENAVEAHKVEIAAIQSRLKTGLAQRSTIQDDYKALENEADGDICTLCKQVLPAGVLADRENSRKARLNDIIKRGNAIQAGIETLTKNIESGGDELNRLNGIVHDRKSEIDEAEQARAARVIVIDKMIEGSKKNIDPTGDAEWILICKAIESAERDLGEPNPDRLTHIYNRQKELNEKLREIDTALAQSDRIAKDNARIKVLASEEKELSQKIADIDENIDEIGRYKMAESEMITHAVNDKFRLVEWKLFKTSLNGNIEDCCECILNGVCYNDMSCGEKIVSGMDIINTISESTKIYCPVFIDNAESLTLKYPMDTQVIKLFAVDGVTALSVT